MSIPVRLVALCVILAWLLASTVYAAEEDSEGPAPGGLKTARRVEGNRVLTYTLFLVLAGMGLTLVFRGIRAR